MAARRMPLEQVLAVRPDKATMAARLVAWLRRVRQVAVVRVALVGIAPATLLYRLVVSAVPAGIIRLVAQR